MTTRDETTVFGRPELTSVQLVPLFVDRKTPPLVPAKRFVPDPPPVGLTIREFTYLFVEPAAVHLVPLLVERKTPPPSVPAKRFAPDPPLPGLIARDKTKVFVRPRLTAIQLAPFFVERKTP